jgi:hypothetical protein
MQRGIELWSQRGSDGGGQNIEGGRGADLGIEETSEGANVAIKLMERVA